MILKGDRLSLARMITLVENGSERARDDIICLHPYTGHAKIIGVTGPPGAGKSTLTGKMVKLFRQAGKTVAVVAVDPTSPFTGGALLGDRLRMTELSTDPGVFIRSMSTRGSLGGLAATTADVLRIIDAAGYDIIIVETVGVGQAEVDIMEIADTVLVITVPGLGDDIQINKAGIMEIGDVFVVNKADRDGADQVATALEMMLDLNPEGGDWRPPIIKVVSTAGKGVDEVVSAVNRHFAYVEESGLLVTKKKKRMRREIIRLLERHFYQTVVAPADQVGLLDACAQQVMEKTMDPFTAVQRIIHLHNR